ncbi:MAG: ATP-binding protein [Myxococcota bacterium]
MTVPAAPTVDKLERRLTRERARVRALEAMIEDRTRSLFLAKEQLHETTRFLESVLSSMSAAVLIVWPSGSVLRVNPAAVELLGVAEADLLGAAFGSLVKDVHQSSDDAREAGPAPRAEDLVVGRREVVLSGADGSEIPVLFSGAPVRGEHGEVEAYVCVATDLREQKRMELELRQSQKLESIGQIAAGIAHEINTPIQFVGDSLQFLGEGIADMRGVLGAYRALRDACGDREELRPLVEKIERAEEEADVEFLAEEMPAAAARGLGGVQRVATIVRAMKDFSHPGERARTMADLNAAIETTLTVARNEYKYCADVELELGEIPPVWCDVGDLNQVFLNLIVNAAHAVEERIGTSGERGVIRVRTEADGDSVWIHVADTGAGIPEHVRHKIFDPFFTTKGVGKGTGQGLAIAHNIVVERHGGEISYDTTIGEGTTFHLRLPIDPGSDAEARA